jgi:UDP-glucose 4-epimerase
MITEANFAGVKVLVTGASGFIGSHLCRILLQSEAEVHGISRNFSPPQVQGLRWWHLDLTEASAVQQLMADVRPDIVFHLASHVAGARDLDLVIPTFQSNLGSTVNLLVAAAKSGCCRRFLVTGSLEEPDPGNPQAVSCSPYAVAKWAGSAYARMFYELYHFPVVIARLFMVYGPEQKDLRKLIPYASLCLLRGEPPRVSSGTRLVDWVYVSDVVDGLLATAVAPDVEGATVDIGSGQLVSVREVVELLAKIVNPQVQPLFGAVADRPLERVRVAEIAQSKALIGWEPKTPLEQGLEQTVAWYEQQSRNQHTG